MDKNKSIDGLTPRRTKSTTAKTASSKKPVKKPTPKTTKVSSTKTRKTNAKFQEKGEGTKR